MFFLELVRKTYNQKPFLMDGLRRFAAPNGTRKGLCRVAVRNGKFAILFPPLSAIQPSWAVSVLFAIIGSLAVSRYLRVCSKSTPFSRDAERSAADCGGLRSAPRRG